ncbi:hypothetical protein BDW67DRAFT_161416 [Aspergillus spinulosporus]
MDRLGIARSKQDLMVLRSVFMSAFPTEHDLTARFREVVKEAVQMCCDSDAIKPDTHCFYIQGTDELFFLHRPRFQEARFRRQLILKGRFNKPGLEAYIRARTKGILHLNTLPDTCLDT